MIQIDMNMPVSCFFCPIKDRMIMLDGKIIRCFCKLTEKELNDTTKRDESCPLIEVKDGEQE